MLILNRRCEEKIFFYKKHKSSKSYTPYNYLGWVKIKGIMIGCTKISVFLTDKNDTNDYVLKLNNNISFNINNNIIAIMLVHISKSHIKMALKADDSIKILREELIHKS